MTHEQAQEVQWRAREVMQRASILCDAHEQDQQKQKWRDHVEWCASELQIAIDELKEVIQ